MAQDRYTQWLKIPPGERPPDHYTLLGLPQFCDDAQRIAQASHDRLDQLDKYALSNDPASREDCQRIMNEVARARVVLTDARKRVAHDVALAAKLGIAPPQAVVMPAQESLDTSEPSDGPAETASMPQVSRRHRVPMTTPVESAGRWSPKALLLIAGAAVGVFGLIVLLIVFITTEDNAAAPVDSYLPSISSAGAPVSEKDAASNGPEAIIGLDMEEARAKCMARLQECRDDKSIMPLIDEWGQRDWQYIMTAIEQGEDVLAAATSRTVQYEKAFDKLGEVMTHARRAAEIIQTTRGAYDEAVAVIDEETVRTRLPTDWTSIHRSVRNATIGALNHRPEDATKHFEAAAKLYRDAATKILAMKLPGVGEPKEPPAPSGPVRLVPVGEPFKGPYHVQHLQFSPNGKLLAAAGQNETLLWDVDAGKPHAVKSMLSETAGIIYFTFSPDSTELHHFTRGNMSSWDLSNLQTPPTKSADWEIGGPLVVGGTFVGNMMPGQKVIEIWDVTTGRPVSQLRHDSRVQFHAISDDGKITITLDESRTHFRVWDTKSGQKLLTPAYPQASTINGPPGSRIALSPDGRFIACCDKYHVQFVATDNKATAQKPLDLTGRGNGRGGIEKLQYSPDGRLLLITMYDQNLDPSMRRSVLIYNTLENRIVGEAHPSGDDGQGRFPRPTMRCSPDGRLMATGGATGVLRIVGLDTGKPVTGDINIGSTIWDITFSPDSKLLAVLYVDALVRIYRLDP